MTALLLLALAADPPVVGGVELQPLAANVERLRTALQFLGASLPAEVVAATKAAADAATLQKALDPRVLVVVTVSPEGRVSATRGPAPAVLQQAGYTPVVVKVVNGSTGTQPLRVGSPQAGPRHGEGWQPQDRTHKGDPGDPARFLTAEVFTAPPMTAGLSGLGVEYAVLLLASTEAGKREATLRFDLGQGSQDVGFRGEVPVLFDVRPAVPVTVRVTDADSQPTVGRFTVTDAAGHVFPPKPKRLAPDFFFQDQVYRPDGGTLLLPPGEFTVTTGRGPEYRLKREKFTVPAKGPAELRVKLERWIDPFARGWVSGDHHIHSAGCAHYTSPTEGVTPEDMFLHVKGEGLNVGCCLTWGPCYEFQRQYFDPGPHKLSEPKTVIKYDIEVSGFGSQALGHVCLLNLRDQTYPGSAGTKTKGWPTWTTPLMRWAKAQGAVTGYAHSANGLGVDREKSTRRLFVALDRGGKGFITPDDAKEGPLPLPEPFAKLDADGDGKVTEVELRQGTDRTDGRLPNLCVPEMNGIGAQEICVTTALGLCDFVSAMDTARVPEWNVWYHLLNCGFPLKVSGETDFPCISGGRVGQGRVYVRQPKADRVDFAAWCDGLRAGRSYVSDGYAHALEFAVGGVAPGFGEVKLDAPGKVAVTTTVAFAADVSLGTAVGGVLPGGKTRTVELVVNGKVAASKQVPADDRPHDLTFDVPVERSSWVALRQFPQLHTNPVPVLVGGKPVRASRDSAKWCVGVIEQLWRAREKAIAPAERAEAGATFKTVIEQYRKIASECE